MVFEYSSRSKRKYPDTPVIMVTDTGREEIAAAGMKGGLSDYISKDYLQRRPIAIRESLEKIRLRQRAESERAQLIREQAARAEAEAGERRYRSLPKPYRKLFGPPTRVDASITTIAAGRAAAREPKKAAESSASELRGEGANLVIDDEEIVRKSARSALERYGYEVLLANNGLEGVRAFRKYKRKLPSCYWI